jgi:hypothetical protein
MNVDLKAMYEKLPLRLMVSPPAESASTNHVDTAMPAEIRNWLVQLRLLEGVPFANLVADTELLPPESIRWFYLDRRWTDAVVQGALSVGTVNSDDRTHLSGAYDAIRDELDEEERNVRRRPDTSRYSGKVEAISGFILRSQAVSGWPGLHVRAFNIPPGPESDSAEFAEDGSNDPQHKRMRLLRLERLAPAVLFCLFDGIPKVVHIEEPRQGVQFGFDVDKVSQRSATLSPRDVKTFKTLSGDPVKVPFRSGAGTSGVVDIQRLERSLVGRSETHVGTELDSSEYALQLVRFPYRQIFGDAQTPAPAVESAFMATLSYANVVSTFLAQG